MLVHIPTVKIKRYLINAGFIVTQLKTIEELPVHKLNSLLLNQLSACDRNLKSTLPFICDHTEWNVIIIWGVSVNREIDNISKRSLSHLIASDTQDVRSSIS